MFSTRHDWLKFFGLILTLLAYMAGRPLGRADTNGVLTKLSQVQALSLQEASNNYPVLVRASVTYCDPEWMMMFIQDETGSVFVERGRPYADPMWLLRPGQVVRLEGITVAGAGQSNIREKVLEASEEVSLPTPVVLEKDDAYHAPMDARWVRATGCILQVGGQNGTKTDARFRAPGGKTLRLMVLNGTVGAVEALRGSMLEVTGVFGYDLDAKGKPTGTNVIWVPGLSWARKVGAIPTTAIASLSALSSATSGVPGHVRGTVTGEKGEKFLYVRDASGMVRANFDVPVSNGEGPVEVVGFPAMEGGHVVLDHAALLSESSLAAGHVLPMGESVLTGANTNIEKLTEVIQVRNLSLAEASRGYPVLVTGVVTYSDPAHDVCFVQDESGGIYIHLQRTSLVSVLTAREKVEVRGYSGPGEFAPIIEAESAVALGEGDFPLPNPSASQTLMTGSQDSQWVTINGIVRSQTVEEDTTVLSISAGGIDMKAKLPNAAKDPAPTSYVDALVELQGVCATDFDDQRRLRGVIFFVPGWSQIRVLDAAPQNAFALPLRPLNDLLRFQAAGHGLHRSHVRGTVSYGRSDGSFYLQDATGGVLVQPEKGAPQVKTGDEVELVAFPSLLNNLPVLQEAVMKFAAGGAPAIPVNLAEGSAVTEGLNGMLVRLQGRVVGHSTSAAQEWLSVQCGPWMPDAVLEKNQPANQLDEVPAGSVVDLTGVCLTKLDDKRKVQSFQVLLRSAKDVAVVSRPSWWTASHTAWVLGTFGVGLALALTWISLLRRQVKIQTHQLREEIEERKRMEQQVDLTHKELVTASRQAGMAEVATSVLHNVGNVLNSVNVSSAVLMDRVQQSRCRQVGKIASTLREHSGDLAEYLTHDAKGRLLVDYTGQLAELLSTEREEMLKELESLRGYIEHIKEIVAMQQRYAKTTGGVMETIPVTDVVEDALRVNSGSFERHHVEIACEYQEGMPKITTDKHKVLQILINLLRNAKHACDDAQREDKRVTLRVRAEGNQIHIQVTDNGVGIPAENLTRIFNHGFTTRSGGHGFGLHSGALAAKELGGKLRVQSAGHGQGATFTLELPVNPAKAESGAPQKPDPAVEANPAVSA